ncbi:MAG: hypothetical protein Tsb002_27000 [Wenzhouxiangellaceae bacterium]
MNTGAGEFAQKIIDHINELFTDQVGPIAAILTEEAYQDWQQHENANKRTTSLKSITGYIRRLANYIEVDNDRQAFLNAVYSIEAIQFYKDYYNEDEQ